MPRRDGAKEAGKARAHRFLSSPLHDFAASIGAESEQGFVLDVFGDAIDMGIKKNKQNDTGMRATKNMVIAVVSIRRQTWSFDETMHRRAAFGHRRILAQPNCRRVSSVPDHGRCLKTYLES